MSDKTSRSRKLAILVIVTALVVAAVGLMLQADRRRVKVRASGSTAMGFFRRTPPPWPMGNSLSVMPRWQYLKRDCSFWISRHLPQLNRFLSPSTLGWGVLNMHAENFSEFCKQQGIKWVEVERFGQDQCLVVDPRVPRTWLLTYPNGPLWTHRELRLARPERFNTPPELQVMIGTEWILVERQDPDGLLEGLLPGERIEFQDMDLLCKDGDGAMVLGRRVWELTGADLARGGVAVFDFHGHAYTGMVGRMKREGDILTFTPSGTMKSVGSSGESSSRYPDPGQRTRQEIPRVQYRLAVSVPH